MSIQEVDYKSMKSDLHVTTMPFLSAISRFLSRCLLNRTRLKASFIIR